MRTPRGALGLAAVVWAFVGGCAEYTAGLEPTDPYSAKSAYVYGRFFIDAESHALALDGHQSMGFSIRCRDGNRYVLRFSNQSALQVIRVAPSVCQIDEVIYTDAAGTTGGRRIAGFRIVDNYDKTTDQLKHWFPGLASAATENRMTRGPNVL